jgi:DNA-nicking Smr family endonuclease
MTKQGIFSYLARLFGRPKRKQAPADNDVPPPPVEPVKKEQPPHPEKPAAAPAKKAKPKRSPAPPSKRKDKKGFAVLSDRADLYELFGEQKKESKGDDDFSRLFEASMMDQGQRRMLNEKKRQQNPALKPLTVNERIKVYPAPQQELDLHGFTSIQAQKLCDTFIARARVNDILTVRIIVGKGLHSEGRAVLRDVIEKRIIQFKQQGWVLSYKWEQKDKRKSGALIVYLTAP